MPELPRVVILRGIQRGVDWRPTQLADHLPSALQDCSLCGGVEPTTITLPCSHAFCDNCLRASKESEDGEHLCVLDGRPFVLDENVVRKKCSTKDAAFIKVACWNSCYGCDFIGPVSLLPEHFEEDCKFHPAVCPRCKVTMLLADLPGHYRSSCTAPLEWTEPAPRSTELNRSTSRSTWGEDVTLTAHDTLVGLESRMNELVEYVRNLDTKSTDMSLSLSEVTEILRQMASTTSESAGCSGNQAECATLSTNPHENVPLGVLQTSESESAEASVASTPSSSVEDDTLSEARGSIRAELLPRAMYSVPVPRLALRRQTTQLTHYMPDRERADREKKAFLVFFRRRKAASSGSASDFMPLYDLLKRGIELSVPETWTAKVALDSNKGCHVKIVILEENSALDVYAKVEERRKTFNPWKVESVRLVHPGESALLSASSGSHPLEPTWTHSRAARLKFPASGYGFYGSHRFEAMCRRGFVEGNDTVTFCVTLMRKWNAPVESTADAAP
ncbi:uncharacterized protein LOC119399568 [Rhipicephalus sanguineus]|uniref:uncharacterized protein LOC119399568 n=1 Tax=Rhipicephalus sanguineus TaxID=34632 RepID=UPI001895B88D|nr:uncharacterized protein LOC119399568 [Rhipicephalus sanguineus]